MDDSDLSYGLDHYSLTDAAADGDLETFTRLISESTKNDREWAMDHLGRTAGTQSHYEILEIAKILVEQYHVHTYIHQPYAYACFSNNFALIQYWNRQFGTEPKMALKFSIYRFCAAIYHNNHSEIQKILSTIKAGNELESFFESVHRYTSIIWVYAWSTYHQNIQLIDIIRNLKFDNPDSYSSKVHSVFKRYDILGLIWHNRYSEFLTAIGGISKKKLCRIFNMILRYPIDYPLHNQTPQVNIPLKFYQYYETHFAEDIYPWVIYTYAKSTISKTPHLELMAYLETRYPKILLTEGIYELIARNDLQGVRENAKYITSDEFSARLAQTSNFEMAQLLLEYIVYEDLQEQYLGQRYSLLMPEIQQLIVDRLAQTQDNCETDAS
jgi:hypothetical protein